MLESVLQVTSTSTSIAQEGVKIELKPIPFGKAETNEFKLFDSDGNGAITIAVSLPDAANFFVIGRRYLISFSAL